MMILFSLLPVCFSTATAGDTLSPASIYGFTVKGIEGNNINLSMYRGKVMLIVNVASKCGYTPQYEGLEALYRKYKDQGLVVLGFPANNFLWQEPGTNEEILAFCRSKYDVTFDMFQKISVKGSDKHPLYSFLTSKQLHPAFGGEVKWNFQKYLVNREGRLIAKFDPGVKPMSEELISAVEKALSEER